MNEEKERYLTELVEAINSLVRSNEQLFLAVCTLFEIVKQKQSITQDVIDNLQDNGDKTPKLEGERENQVKEKQKFEFNYIYIGIYVLLVLNLLVSLIK